MKRFSLLILSLILLIPVSAVTIPAGTYHFDNNVTHYSHVKFLYGQQTQGKTVIISLTQQADGLWTFTIPETVTGQSHYFFSDTSLPDGDYPMSVTSVKDDIAGKRGERRTQTFKDQDNTPMIPGATFVPNSTDQYTSGRWVTAVSSTQTLPALHIDTEGGVRITSKETYINATYYLEANGVEGVSDIATASEPLPMLIRGRGNYTWTGFDKKPYRIKLSASAPLAGMEKSKHFVLMAGADDNLAYMRNPLGYELSRRMGLAWTPDCRPVELYLNSKYEGLYFLTENIRVDKDRVNVTEQDDNATGDVTGGWLVEVDNYNTDPHISVNMPDKRQQMWVTYHSPEILSAQQETYLQQQFDAIRDAIYTSSTSSTLWETLIDPLAMARLYVVREIMQDEEGFHGSFYLHKERGEDTRWVAGPVWDFGNAFRQSTDAFIWDNPTFECFIIDRLYRFPRFQELVRNVFGDFYRLSLPSLPSFLDSLAATIRPAMSADYARWPSYSSPDIDTKVAELKRLVDKKIAWLAQRWGTDGTLSGIRMPDTGIYTAPSIEGWYTVSGIAIGSQRPTAPGVYVYVCDGERRKVVVR